MCIRDSRVAVRLAPVPVAGLVRPHAEADGRDLSAGDVALRLYRPERLVIRRLAGPVIPVSYTHLDVYKRQVHVFAQRQRNIQLVELGLQLIQLFVMKLLMFHIAQPPFSFSLITCVSISHHGIAHTL